MLSLRTAAGMQFLFALALTACSSSQSKPGGDVVLDRAKYVTEATVRTEYLHHLNIGDSQGLKKKLEGERVFDILVLFEMTTTPGITEEQQTRAWKTLCLIAVQNEKFPVKSWDQDGVWAENNFDITAKVKAILSSSLDHDPQYTAQVRARNWNKPWWMP